MSKRQREKLMNGMSSRQARQKFLEIWKEKKPEQNFRKLYGNLWPWLETWHRLRSRNETLETVLTSFAGTVRTKNIQIHKLSQVIFKQREELHKLQPAVNADGGQGPNAPSESDTKELRPKRGLPGKGE